MKTRTFGFRACCGNVFSKILVFILALVATFALMWVLLLPSIATGLIKKRTGFDATVRKFYVNPFTASVDIEQLRITNPETFPQKDFVTVNQFRIVVDPSSTLSNRVVIKDAVFDIALVALVKNAQGQTNIDAFKAGLIPPQPAPPPGQNNAPAPPPAEKKPPKQFLIQHLVVKLDKIIVADYTGSEPNIREIPLNINRTFTDVTDPNQITGPLLADLSVAGLGDIANNVLSLIVPAPILQQLGVITKGADNVLQQTGKKTKDFFQGLFDSLEEPQKK